MGEEHIINGKESRQNFNGKHKSKRPLRRLWCKMRIILKWILAKQSWREGNGVILWLSTGTSSMLWA